MQEIINDIRNNQLKQVYLLYGAEDYLRLQFRDKLKQAMLPAGDTMNYAGYEGSDIPIGEVIDLAETMPLFAEKRLIVIENSGLFKEGGEKLAEYLAAPSPTVYFIFSEKDIDKRSR